MTDLSPFDTVQQAAGGYCVARCLHTIADLGIADLLDSAPRTAEDLARDANINPDALDRALRLLAANGIFEANDNTFSHSPASALLRSDHPQSMRAFARMIGLPINWTIYGAMAHSVRTGRPATEQVLPDGYWGHFATHPQDGAVFNEAMQAKAYGQCAGIVAAYDFSGFRTIADIGGGHGHLLRAIVGSSPQTNGVLFDLPQVIGEVAKGMPPQITLQAGDFFCDELPTCDAYVAMDIIHDWDDEKASEILAAIRRAATPPAKLLLMETMISDGKGNEWGKMLDIHMLVLLGGRQRTREEYEQLLTGVGFVFRREIDTHAGISILEADAI